MRHIFTTAHIRASFEPLLAHLFNHSPNNGLSPPYAFATEYIFEIGCFLSTT